MDLRLEYAGRSLSNFLEDDLSGAYLGFRLPLAFISILSALSSTLSTSASMATGLLLIPIVPAPPFQNLRSKPCTSNFATSTNTLLIPRRVQSCSLTVLRMAASVFSEHHRFRQTEKVRFASTPSSSNPQNVGFIPPAKIQYCAKTLQIQSCTEG